MAISGFLAGQGGRGAKKGALDEAVGPNPTDRGKPGTKCNLLSEGQGVPLCATIMGANVHDQHGVEPTLDTLLIARPDPQLLAQHLCTDGNYANPSPRQAVAE